MRLANNLHVREDKAATARKRGGKPKPHREFRRDYFRGGNAPASLKQVVNALQDLVRGEFPGWKRPGLIEASKLREENGLLELFPGWKRPGLIEAYSLR